MAHFIYGVATNTGKGFFTAEDRRAFFLRGYPADVWVVGNNELIMATYSEIHGRAIESLSSDPSATAATEGKIWYNTTSNTFKVVLDDGGLTVKTITTS